MKGVQLHNNYARRREEEQIRNEKSAAVNRYFDKWGQITHRFDSWTTPEYYKQAEDAVKLNLETKAKSLQLERRRETLRKQLEGERQQLEEEIKERGRRPKSLPVPNAVLMDIHTAFRRKEDERRRMELESQLYKQWRYSDREAAILHDSKSDHEAMAKMNWLDKQVLLQVERDAEKRDSEVRMIRLREESRLHAEHMDERRRKRDEEIADIKQYQESHLLDLKTRSTESDSLRQQETHIRHTLDLLQEEQQSIVRSTEQRAARSSTSGSVNVRRIKLLLRQRSDTICADLREDIATLDRLSSDTIGTSEQIINLRDVFESKLDEEKQLQRTVEAMYESEAKMMLATQERVWADEEAARGSRIWRIVEERAKVIRRALAENVNKQRELVQVKEAHLKAVQTANDRLKDLMADQRKDEMGLKYSTDTNSSSYAIDTMKNQNVGSTMELLRKSSISSASSVSSDLSAPQYGRKKIAWM